MTFLRYISAEFIKLRYLPIMWLSAVVVFAVMLIVFSAHFIDVNSIRFDVDPWRRTLVACRGIFSVFMAIPFIVLLVSAALYVEHQSNAWKYQYTVPIDRMVIVISKLVTILLWVIATIFLLTLGLIMVGYILDAFLPEYEFAYYKIPYWIFVERLSHNFISLLGVIGIQYFLSYRFRGFLLPASIGIVAFLCGLILGTTNNTAALFYPYSYPIIVDDMGMFKLDKVGIVEYGVLNNVELYSIIVFLLFVVMTGVIEQRRNIA